MRILLYPWNLDLLNETKQKPTNQPTNKQNDDKQSQ